MLKTIASTLPDAAAVTEQLVARYGPEQLRQVEQLSEHFFRARIRDGSMAMAIVQPEGQVVIRELEEVG
ncbi:hypothetical protein ACTQ4E_03115 [Lawsonibacter sp. LCP25S3_G6]|uniref:hypothetical protein n=1 Tax=unclassified Lawsonibacter TaxID=2617946 RepID=UPI003F9A1FE3